MRRCGSRCSSSRSSRRSSQQQKQNKQTQKLQQKRKQKFQSKRKPSSKPIQHSTPNQQISTPTKHQSPESLSSKPTPKHRRQQLRYQKRLLAIPKYSPRYEETLFEQAKQKIKRKILKNYGFVANPNLSVRHNAYNYILQQSIDILSHQPTHKAFHNLCTHIQPPKFTRNLLGLNLNFALTPK